MQTADISLYVHTQYIHVHRLPTYAKIVQRQGVALITRVLSLVDTCSSFCSYLCRTPKAIAYEVGRTKMYDYFGACL